MRSESQSENAFAWDTELSLRMPGNCALGRNRQWRRYCDECLSSRRERGRTVTKRPPARSMKLKLSKLQSLESATSRWITHLSKASTDRCETNA
jgi:hypothetical protein